MDILNKIIYEDCYKAMKEIPNNSIDLIVTSPPYADARAHTYGGTKPDDYVNWFLPKANEMYRILKPTGSFILNIKEKCVNGERHTYVLNLILQLKKEVNFRWVEEYLWHKTSSCPGKWKYRFRDGWERLLHFSKTKDFAMYQDAVKVPIGNWANSRLKNLSEKDKTRQESATHSGHGKNLSNWIDKKMVYPDNVIYTSPVTFNKNHSAAFPDEIPKFFIKLFTKENDIVLDPFVGSGTTFNVARQLNRNAIGMEILSFYS